VALVLKKNLRSMMMSKCVYIAQFEDGDVYVGYVDENCRRLKPYEHGRIGLHGRLQTKFKEQKRCWSYTAPVYEKAYAGYKVTSADIVESGLPLDVARSEKKRLVQELRDEGRMVLNG
jgi:predicted GIY-YIG superfamily endonuclease